MPQYHSHDNPIYGHVKILPLPFWRKIYKRPYWVGDKVKFEVILERIPPESYYVPVIYERFKDEERILMNIKEERFPVEGNTIPLAGDVVYSIGYSQVDQWNSVIFTATVKNHDTEYFERLSLVLAALVTLSCTIIAWLLTKIP